MPTAGSSPLARGLPASQANTTTANRIIPARAGSTTRSPGRPASGEDHPRSRGVYEAPRYTCPRPQDHPRSRGVYPTTSGQMGGDVGSSPLARGLLGVEAWAAAFNGIIPARAGSTRGLRATPDRAMDHPRSRGVYALRRSGMRAVTGSSPLARGLRRSQASP